MNCPAFKYGSAIGGPSDQREGGFGGDRAVMPDQAQKVAFSHEDMCVEADAQAGGTLRNALEHRLGVTRRAANDLKDLRSCRLLLYGFVQSALYVLIGRLWCSSLRGILHRRPAPRAELCVRHGLSCWHRRHCILLLRSPGR